MTKPKKYKHVDCLVKTANITTHQGVTVEVFDLKIDQLSKASLRRWSTHFREHYCLDSTIDSRMTGTPFKTRREFLLNMAFPNMEGFGPATRSGDFTEILLSDFIESILDFWVPRTRYRSKQIPNESPKGSDIVGMKFVSTPAKHSPQDTLMTFEVKASMSPQNENVNRLQDAIDDAKKDAFDDAQIGDARGAFRVALTLNALKQRYIDFDDKKGWKAVERFQDPLARPYVHQIGASAVFCTSAFSEDTIKKVSTAAYPTGTNLMLVVVKGDEMMKLVHSMYERAANEA